MILTCTAARRAKLSSILHTELSMSTGLIKRLKYDHAFAVNGTPQRTNYIVEPGDTVTVRVSDTNSYHAEILAIEKQADDGSAPLRSF